MEALIILMVFVAALFFGVKHRYEVAQWMNLPYSKETVSKSREADDKDRVKFLVRRIEDDTEELTDLEKK